MSELGRKDPEYHRKEVSKFKMPVFCVFRASVSNFKEKVFSFTSEPICRFDRVPTPGNAVTICR